MTLATLATEIHDRAWDESSVKPVGRTFVLQYLPKLVEANPLELFAYSFKNFDFSYNLAFLLSTPELWEAMTVGDWVELMKRLSPRPPITIFDPTACYSDLVFFHKWLNLDGLGLALSQCEISAEDRRRMCHYCRANVSSILPSEEDAEDLDGKTLCPADQRQAAGPRPAPAPPLLGRGVIPSVP